MWTDRRGATDDLDDLIVGALPDAKDIPRWQAFAQVDDILDHLAVHADRRLAYQARHPIQNSPTR
jgi:hypothetical protein